MFGDFNDMLSACGVEDTCAITTGQDVLECDHLPNRIILRNLYHVKLFVEQHLLARLQFIDIDGWAYINTVFPSLQQDIGRPVSALLKEDSIYRFTRRK